MTRKHRRKLERRERRQELHATSAAERFLARAFERLLAEPEFASYLRAHWHLVPVVDHAGHRIDIQVRRRGADEPDAPPEIDRPACS